ncbi:MAG: nuclear transport factor 2 family protein, partial [Pseudomonadota bacterium]
MSELDGNMDAGMIEKFVALETGVWDALISGDGAADAALLSEDFLGVYETGFSNRTEHAAMLDKGPIVAAYRIEQATVRVISTKAVLLCYLALYTKPADPSKEERMYVSSLWEEIDGQWLNTFSQDTDAG